MNRGDKSAKPVPTRCQHHQRDACNQNKKVTKDSRRSSSSKTRPNHHDTRGTQSDSEAEVKSAGKGKRPGDVLESVPNSVRPIGQRKLSDGSNASEDYSKDSGCVSWKLSSSDSNSSSEMSDCTSEGNKADPQSIDPELSWVDGSASVRHGSGPGDGHYTSGESKDTDRSSSDLGVSVRVVNVSENYPNVMMVETNEDLMREVDDLRSENEYLKDEMEELRCEMEEMRDMFQEEEVYQLQALRLQLDQANKTRLILQYRLRKAERRSIRVAQTGQVDGELVRSLEHDVKVAKSVSLRLRNELESVQKKNSLLDVENEALRERTQELEVAKQVLQTEVDKVFSKENSLKRRSVRSPTSKAEKRLSQQIEEDSADLKCQLHFAKEELVLMCKKLTKLVSESEGMRVELARYHSAYGDVDTSQFPEGKANHARARETEVKAHLKLVEEEATLLSRRIVELEVENCGLRAEMSDLRDKCGGATEEEEEEEEPMEFVAKKQVSQDDPGWELGGLRGQSVSTGHTAEYTQDNAANDPTNTGVVESSVLGDVSPAQTKGMLSVCQITRQGPVGGEWSPLVREEARAKTIFVLQKLLQELEAECPGSQTACDSETKTMRCKTNELDQENPVKTWDHPIMPQNFPDLDFEQISTDRSHTAPESTAFRIYYSPPSARRVQLAQLRQSPTADTESVATASPWCTPRSSLSPLYLGLSANLSDDMKEMTASWRQVAPPEGERRRSSGAWVDVACSGTQTKRQPQMVSVALQTDGPQGVASVRNSPSRVQSPSSARVHHTSMEKVNVRATRPRQTSPKLYRRHSSSLPTTTTFGSSSLTSSSSSSTPSRERALLNLSNQDPASTTWTRPASSKAGHIHSTLNSDFGSPCRTAKPPSKAAGTNRYGLVTEFLRKVSGRAEKSAPGPGPKGKSDLKNLERIPTRPPAVPLHRNDSVTRIVNQRFMKQREEKGTSQNQAIRGAIPRDSSMNTVTAEEGNYDCSSSSTLAFCFARPSRTTYRQPLNPSKPRRHGYSPTFSEPREPSYHQSVCQWEELKLHLTKASEHCYMADVLHAMYMDKTNYVYLTFLKCPTYRCIEPIDSARYTQWSCGDREIECAVEPHNEVLLSSESDRAVRGQAGEGPEEGLSFTEVIRLVQAGQSVPGLGTHVDITPSNQKPTPSQMERVLKPWESR
ncbi:hypothetical protein NHX12_012810 [Muraenolepis orangiensis]|uniref:Uncharacterized protein n=1 Tax=Muraenolepis orangiensis TaxID=630683 RepID=A0A9Q0DGV9_9TELE|nr:hypothetical protein NHX12_012810 [Muraenolepis orangiensis]